MRCSSTNGDRELEFLANGGRRSPWLMGDTRKQIGEMGRNPHRRQGQRSGMQDPAPDPLSQSRQGQRGPQRTSSLGVSSDIKKASSTANIVDDLSSPSCTKVRNFNIAEKEDISYYACFVAINRFTSITTEFIFRNFIFSKMQKEPGKCDPQRFLRDVRLKHGPALRLKHGPALVSELIYKLFKCRLIDRAATWLLDRAHPWIKEVDQKKICGVMDCQKLTLEVCTRAAQNEHLSLRAVLAVGTKDSKGLHPDSLFP
ncbi:BTB/POZ domain-containing protein-like protein [Tanacetum coccineum]